MIKFLMYYLGMTIPILFGYGQTKEEVINALSYVENSFEVYQIIMYETGYLSSNSLLVDKNLFGMQCPKIRPTVSIGCRVNGLHQFAQYLTWEDSITDFEMWVRWNKKRRPYNQYDDFYHWLKANNWNVLNKNYYKILRRVK